MVAWEVMGKGPTQVLEEGKVATEAVVSLAEMEATVAKVEMEGSELQAEMVVMAAMVETQLELLPFQHHLPTRVSPGRKSSACFGQSCAKEFSLRQSVVDQPPQRRHRNLRLPLFGGSRQSLNHPKLSTKGWHPCPCPISPTSDSNTF